MKLWSWLAPAALLLASDARAIYLECATARIIDAAGEQTLVEMKGERLEVPGTAMTETQILYRTTRQRNAGQPGTLVTRNRTFRKYEVEEYPNRTQGTARMLGEPVSSFWAKFDLRPDGRLTFHVRTSRSETDKSQFIHAALEFQNALLHFGNRVKSIEGFWGVGSTNLELFRKALAEGKSPEEAALSTWTGQQAAAHGFSVPTISEETRMDLRSTPLAEHPSPIFRFSRREIPVVPETGENSYNVREGPFHLNFELVPDQQLRHMTQPNWTRDPQAPRTNLTYTIRVLDANGRSSGGIDPQTELRNAFAHFGRFRVQAVDAYFHRGSPEMAEYVEARHQGFTPKQAALKTWVGREAAAQGYTVVEYGHESRAKLKVWGRFGEPESLSFRFRRPRH